MKFISLLSLCTLIGIVCTDCSKKEADIPPTLAALEGYSWKMIRSTTISGGKEYEDTLTDCDKGNIWIFKAGILLVTPLTGCANNFYVRRNNGEKYKIINGELLLGIQISGCCPGQSLFFKGNIMIWEQGPIPGTSTDTQRTYFS